MHSFQRLCVLTALLALAAAPAAQAEWRAFGTFEPDNALDSSAFLRTQPPGATQKNLVYFNGFTAHSIGIVSIGANPNVGALQTRNEVAGFETYVAMLGNWVDCNGDGYVGHAESALREYEAALLLDTTRCPAATGAPDAWDGSHNYNGWVTELIPIGGDGGQPSSGFNGDDLDGNGVDDDNAGDLRIVRDRSARVWGDFGRHDDPATATPPTCPIRPFPRGTVQSTGGVLDYVDCRVDVMGRWNSVFSPAISRPTPLGTVTVPGPGDPLGLRFADEDDGRSGRLGQVDTLGTEDSSRAAVTLTDCSSPEVLNTTVIARDANDALGRPLADEDLALVVPNLAPRQADPRLHGTQGATLPGQLNATNEELFGNCDTSDDAGRDTYGLLEADFEPGSDTHKTAALFNMEFEDNLVALGALGAGTRGAPPFDLLHPGGSGMNQNFAGPTFNWFARVALAKGPPATVATRVDLDDGTADADVADATYMTYYAAVGSVTLARYTVPGGSGEYGAPQCGGIYSGVRNGWVCSPAAWYRNGDGTPQAETQGGLARPGAAYQLRDVDCHDGSNGIGVPAGLPALGPRPCVPFGS